MFLGKKLLEVQFFPRKRIHFSKMIQGDNSKKETVTKNKNSGKKIFVKVYY